MRHANLEKQGVKEVLTSKSPRVEAAWQDPQLTVIMQGQPCYDASRGQAQGQASRL